MNSAPTESPFEGRWWRGVAIVICFASVVWLAIGFLVGAQVDDEEYWHSIPSSIIAAQGLWRGELDLWTSHFGLGVTTALWPELVHAPTDSATCGYARSPMGPALLHGAPDCGGLRDLAPSPQSRGLRIRRRYRRSNLHIGLASSKLRAQGFLAVAVVGIHAGAAVAVRSSCPV